jgi:hypothetical protein
MSQSHSDDKDKKDNKGDSKLEVDTTSPRSGAVIDGPMSPPLSREHKFYKQRHGNLKDLVQEHDPKKTPTGKGPSGSGS